MNELANAIFAALINGKRINYKDGDCYLVLPNEGMAAGILKNDSGYKRGLSFLDIINRADQFIIVD